MHDNLPKDQQEKIKEFVVAALEYNKTHNIFSRETEEEVYKKDVLDCIPLVEKIKNQNTVLDLGSGGGFPGIILSITKPQNPISLLEGSEKKCYFLKKIKHNLCEILKLTQKNTHKKTKYLLLKGKEKTINKELKDIDNTRYKYEIIKQDTSYLERNIILIKPNE